MSSTPKASSPSAISPPGPTPAQLPSKKRSSTLDVNAPNKRRKPSASSATPSHPLRQTSFPPEAGSPFARSPSADATSLVSGSAVSGVTTDSKTKKQKKRGRKPKGGKGGEDPAERTPSLVNSKAPTNVNGQGGAGDKDGEDDDLDDRMEMDVEDTQELTREQEQEEHRLRAMLYQAFDHKQRTQYEVWRTSRINDGVIRRVVNATVSQSVPASVVTAMKVVTKLFAGEIIEHARRVQDECVKGGEKQADLPTPPSSNAGEGGGDGEPDPRRGPLRPEHLAEAWRRYKLSGESRGVGVQLPWHAQQGDGVERFSTRTGKRLFK